MANSDKRAREYVAAEKRKGTAPAKIIVGLTKLDGQTGKDMQKAVKQLQNAGLSPTQELGKYFGLSTKPVDPKAKKPVNKNASIGQKAKSYATSAALGLSDAGAGIVQGMAYAADGVNKGINKVAGTNYKTNAADEYKSDYKAANDNADLIRRDAGRQGGDFVRGGTELAATVPVFLAGGAPTAGVKGLGAFAAREGAIGAGVGAARYAENGKERARNSIGGAVGGAIGGVVGVGAGKLAGKTVGAVARRSANKSGRTATAATKLVDDAIAETGIRVTPAARTNLVNEATKNLSKSKQVDAAAAVRKSLLDSEGFRGTNAQVNKNAQNWTVERQTAKSSPDLNEAHIGQNEQLTSKWQSLADETGARPVDNNARMQSTFETLGADDAARKAAVKANYDAATNSAGIQTPVNKTNVANNINQQLKDNLLDINQPNQVGQILKRLDDPDYTMTIGDGEQYIKTINKALKTAFGTGDEPALQIAKKAIQDELESAGALIMQQGDSAAKETVELLNTARASHGARMNYINKNKVLEAATKDKPVDDAFKSLVLNSKERDLVKLVDDLRATPQGQQNLADLQGATIEHFITKATGADNGAFNTAMLNKAINSFGNNRMRALFTPEQIARINDIQKVGDILMQRPQGAHINDSNTASTLINQLIGIANMTGKIPVLGNVGIGLAKTVGDLAQSGAGAKMINGQPAITRGSSLGLTDEQLRLLGMMPAAGQAGAAVGANLGN